MKPVPTDVRNALAGQFGYAPEQLMPLGGGRGDSDGIAYSIQVPGGRYVFKIVGADAGNPYAQQTTQARAALFSYLGGHGLEVVAPEPNAAGNLTEMIVADDDAFIAYTYPYVAGDHPSPETWDEALIGAWGRTIGAAHRLTKGYPIWEGIALPEHPDHRLLCFREELHSFLGWCADAEVKSAWQSLEVRIDMLSKTRDDLGFIHNDPHMQNILFENGRVKLLDFDVATCHFFAADLAIAIQSVLFTQGGGMYTPVQDQNAIDRFTGALLNGYAMENTLSGQALASIELFVAYRRALLFTVMQEWLGTEPENMAAWKRMIRDEPRILNL